MNERQVKGYYARQHRGQLVFFRLAKHHANLGRIARRIELELGKTDRTRGGAKPDQPKVHVGRLH